MLAFRRSAPLLAALVAAAACHPARSAPAPVATPSASPASTGGSDAAAAAPDASSEPQPSAASSPRPPPVLPPLPPGVEPGVPVTMPVPGDAALRVVQGRVTTLEAIVYLPGLCGDITAIDSWAQAASRYGTLVAVNGDIRCHGSKRFRWSTDVARIQKRVDRALGIVKKSRGGLLRTSELTLIGYSQGATRAQALAARFPGRYPRVLLGSAPTGLSGQKLSKARAVAVVCGQLEAKAKLHAGVAALEDAGEPVRFLVLPDVGHGHYGPDADRVMGQALDFLFRAAPPDGASARRPPS